MIVLILLYHMLIALTITRQKLLSFPSWIQFPVTLSSSFTDASTSVSTEVSINTSQASSLILHRPALNPIPITPSLTTTPANIPAPTPKTTPIKLQRPKSLTLPLSDTDFPLFDITPTHSLPPHFYISDPRDIDS